MADRETGVNDGLYVAAMGPALDLFPDAEEVDVADDAGASTTAIVKPSSLRPFWTYYGGKWKVGPRYPVPLHDTIIEPFAGAAGYSLRYFDRKIILIEKD